MGNPEGKKRDKSKEWDSYEGIEPCEETVIVEEDDGMYECEVCDDEYEVCNKLDC